MIADSNLRDCPACGARPRLLHESTADGRERFVATCHGSFGVFFLSVASIASPESKALDELAGWLRGLFVLDAFPDMRELLAYNRGALPVARRP